MADEHRGLTEESGGGQPGSTEVAVFSAAQEQAIASVVHKVLEGPLKARSSQAADGAEESV